MFPIPSALLVKIGIVVAIFLTGYFLGWNGEHKKFVQFKADIAALGKAQEVLNEAKVKEHENTSIAIKDEYEARLAAVRNYYANRMQPNPSGGNMPPVSGATPRIDESAGNTVFVGQCAEVTQQLVSLQKWIQSVGQDNAKELGKVV